MSPKKTSRGAGWKPQDVHFKQRYEDGYRYLDRCGEFLLAAEKEYGFVCSEVVPAGARIEIPEHGISASVDTKEIRLHRKYLTMSALNSFLLALAW